MLLTRHFRVVKLENKKVEIGGVVIKHKANPQKAACKLLTSIAHEKGLTKNKKVKLGNVKFSIQEYTQGSKKKIYGPYLGYFHKYSKNEIKESYSAGGKIKFTMKPIVKLFKEKKAKNMLIQKGKGGTFSTSKTENQTKQLIDNIEYTISKNQDFNKYIEEHRNNPILKILTNILNKGIYNNELKYKLFTLNIIFDFTQSNEISSNKKNLIDNQFKVIKEISSYKKNLIDKQFKVIKKIKNGSLSNSPEYNQENSFYYSLNIGIIIYVKNASDHQKYNLSSYTNKKESKNFKVLFFKNKKNLHEILQYFDSNSRVKQSTTSKCVLDPIRLRVNDDKTYCISNYEDYIVKYDFKRYINKKDTLIEGSFVVDNSGSIYTWDKFNEYFNNMTNEFNEFKINLDDYFKNNSSSEQNNIFNGIDPNTL